MISLILVLTILWCLCVVISCVVRKGCLLWQVHSLNKTGSLFPVSFCTPRPNLLVLQLSLDFLLLYSSPLWWKRDCFLVLVLEGLVGLHRTGQLQLLRHQWLGHRLGLLWYWMVCLGNEPRSFCRFWDCTKYCILESSVDYEGSSTSSKWFLPTVVDMKVIWIKFTHSGRF